ncbi:MAG: alpha/beta hydrolase [Ignavibacteria bacterium]|nr:alpha/beta hydrolase [Ignavibacteria bacterium]
MKTLVSIVAGGLGFYLLVCLLVYFFQEQMLFFPQQNLVATPAEAGLEFEEVSLSTNDGITLHGWFVPAGDSAPTLLYFHGNAGNISHRLESLKQFHQIGLNTLIIDYRGYGKSQGAPDEEGLYRDADAAWHYLTATRQIPESSIVLLGRSLGGAVAAYLAAEQSPQALILESTFTSVPDRGAELYPYLPVRFLSRMNFDSYGRLAHVRCPVLIVHSPEDEIVPYSHGRRLYEAAPEPKQFLRISGGHNDGFYLSATHYLQGLTSFLSDYR